MKYKMSYSTLLLTVLMLDAFYSTKIQCVAADCTPVNYVRFRDRIAEGVSAPAQVGHPGRFLANAYIFGCHGVITQWEAYTFNTGPHPIEFHVWRENKTISDVFHLVGMNTFQDVQPDANHLISFAVPFDQQITVAPGDIAGIRTIDQVTQDEGFRIQFDEGGSYRQYYRGIFITNRDESVPTPSTLELRPSISGAFATASTPGRSPIMRAVVSEIGSNTSSSMNTTFQTPTTTAAETPVITSPSGILSAIIIAIAVLGGVLVLVGLALLPICCLLYIRNRKLPDNQTPPVEYHGHQSQTYPVANNPSYNVSNNTINVTGLVNNQAYVHSDNPQLVRNEAYNSNNLGPVDSSQLVNNPAYNVDGNDDPYYSVIRE